MNNITSTISAVVSIDISSIIIIGSIRTIIVSIIIVAYYIP